MSIIQTQMKCFLVNYLYANINTYVLFSDEL